MKLSKSSFAIYSLLHVRKVSLFRKHVFYNSAPSYKRETKSVKCRGVYLKRTKWIVRNSKK